jgi:hypothetical protein
MDTIHILQQQQLVTCSAYTSNVCIYSSSSNLWCVVCIRSNLRALYTMSCYCCCN